MVMAICSRYFLSSLKQAYYVGSRGITMSTPNREKLLEDLQKNPFYEKYSTRIAALQETSPEEFMQRVEQQQSNKEKEKKTKFASVDTSQFSSVLNPKSATKDSTTASEKKLSDIFKIELVVDKNASEIQSIWEEYHKNKEVISATIPRGLYTVQHENMKRFPTFLFPLPRSQGYEFILGQSYGHTVHFTPLLAYQVHKENAPECLTTVHFTELQDKGIVLMRGDYDKNVLSAQEAQCLANQYQMYYSGRDQRKQELLETFTRSPDTFKHMDLITELENITLV